MQTKKLLFLSWFLFFFLDCYCGQKGLQAQVINPIDRIDSLNEQAWDYYYKDLNSFRLYGQHAWEESIEVDYLRGKCESIQIIGTYYYSKGSLDSALFFYEKALAFRLELGDSSMISGSLNNIANVFEKQGKYIEAIDQYEESILFVPRKNKLKRARINSNIGVIYIRIGSFKQSLIHIDQALVILEKHAYGTLEYGKCLLNKGNLYQRTNNYNEAQELFLKAREIFNSLDNKLYVAKVTNNIAGSYLKMGKLEMAIDTFNAVLTDFGQFDAVPEIAGARQNLGLAYRFKGDIQKSLENLSSSISIWKKIGNNQKIGESLIMLGDLYLVSEQYTDAISAFSKADSLLPAYSSSEYELCYGFAKTYEKLGLSEEALQYHSRCISLLENINAERNRWRNLENQYQENKNKIIILEKEKDVSIEKRKKEKILMISLSIVIALLILLVLALFVNRKNTKKRQIAELVAIQKQKEIESLLVDQELHSVRHILEVQDKERKRIAQDLHDKLGSMLSMVKLYFQRTNDRVEKLRTENQEEYAKANSLLDEACDEVRRIAHNLSSGILKNFGLVAAIEELKNTLVNSGQYEVEFITHKFDDRLSQDYEVIIYKIIQELIANIIRHAKANEISIQLLKKKEYLHIEVADNGIGFAKSGKTDSGFGFKSIESRLFPIKGNLEIDSQPGKGTTVFIKTPLDV